MTNIISIGRNYEDNGLQKQLTHIEWEFFKKDIYALFEEVYFFGEGIGYLDAPVCSISETSYTVIGAIKEDPNTIENIRELAKKYKQKEIAITHGKTRFVKANKEDEEVNRPTHFLETFAF